MRLTNIGRAACFLPALALYSQSPIGTIIDGDIDSAKALQILYGNYDSAKKESRSKDYLDVMPYRTQNGVVEGKTMWFLYTIERDNQYLNKECLACTVMLSAAAFEQQGDHWVLTSLDYVIAIYQGDMNVFHREAGRSTGDGPDHPMLRGG